MLNLHRKMFNVYSMKVNMYFRKGKKQQKCKNKTIKKQMKINRENNNKLKK